MEEIQLKTRKVVTLDMTEKCNCLLLHIFKFITTQKSIITAQNSERASELETTPAQMVLVCKTRIRQAKPRGGAEAPTAPPLATSLYQSGLKIFLNVNIDRT